MTEPTPIAADAGDVVVDEGWKPFVRRAARPAAAVGGLMVVGVSLQLTAGELVGDLFRGEDSTILSIVVTTAVAAALVGGVTLIVAAIGLTSAGGPRAGADARRRAMSGLRTLRIWSTVGFVLGLLVLLPPAHSDEYWGRLSLPPRPMLKMFATFSLRGVLGDGVGLAVPFAYATCLGCGWVAVSARRARIAMAPARPAGPAFPMFEGPLVAAVAELAAADGPALSPVSSTAGLAPAGRPVVGSDEPEAWQAVLAGVVLAALALGVPLAWPTVDALVRMSDAAEWTNLRAALPSPVRDLGPLLVAAHLLWSAAAALLAAWAAACCLTGPRWRRQATTVAAVAVVAALACFVLATWTTAILRANDRDDLATIAANRSAANRWRALPAPTPNWEPVLRAVAGGSNGGTLARLLVPAAVLLVLTRRPMKSLFDEAAEGRA